MIVQAICFYVRAGSRITQNKENRMQKLLKSTLLCAMIFGAALVSAQAEEMPDMDALDAGSGAAAKLFVRDRPDAFGGLPVNGLRTEIKHGCIITVLCGKCQAVSPVRHKFFLKNPAIFVSSVHLFTGFSPYFYFPVWEVNSSFRKSGA